MLDYWKAKEEEITFIIKDNNQIEFHNYYFHI